MFGARRTTALALLVAGLLFVAACGDDDTTEADAGASAPDKGSDEVVDGPGEADETRDAGAAALAFFQESALASASFASDVGNPEIDPTYFSGARVIGEVDGGVEIEDGVGNRLVVDVAGGVIFPVDGVDAPLPREYAFGCSETLFLGTLDEGPGDDIGDDAGEDPMPPVEGDDPELESMNTLVDSWEAGDRVAASQVASDDVLDLLENLHGWTGHPAELVFVNFDGTVAADYYECDRCSYYFETEGDSLIITLEGDFITSLDFGD